MSDPTVRRNGKRDRAGEPLAAPQRRGPSPRGLGLRMRFLYSRASLSLGRTFSPSRSISFKWEMHSCLVSHSPTLAADHYYLRLRDAWEPASSSQVTTPKAP